MIELPAPAKVNLTLRVLGKRPDGFHEIESLVQKVDLADLVRLEDDPGGGISLSCSDPALPSGTDNLAWKAAILLKEASGRALGGVRIALEKRIPTGAGLGGGSSDAAAVLSGLNRLWGVGMGTGDLAVLGSRLGSDVPLFLHPSPSIMRGRGEIVEPAPWRLPAFFVIVHPGFGVSTAWAYANFRLTNPPGKYRISPLSRAEGGSLPPKRWKELLVNDLEGCVLPAHPGISLLKEDLLGLGARGALMSGSGSAVFGLFDREDRAREAVRAFEVREPFRVFFARPLFS